MEKKYIVQNLGTPSEFMFPRVFDKANNKIIHVGRPTIDVKNGDEISLLPEQADRLVRQGYLKEVKKAKGDK